MEAVTQYFFWQRMSVREYIITRWWLTFNIVKDCQENFISGSDFQRSLADTNWASQTGLSVSSALRQHSRLWSFPFCFCWRIMGQKTLAGNRGSYSTPIQIWVNSRFGHWMQCQGQKVKQAEFCTCPEEVIEEALGNERHWGDNVLVCSQGTFPLLLMGL